MPPGQAFVIALVTVLAVFGYLYIVWRSTVADKTGLYLRRVMSAVLTSMLVGSATFFVLLAKPNILISVGLGIAVYASALKNGFMGWHRYQDRPSSHGTLKTILRFYSGGNVVAAGFCGIGCLIYGGAVGVIGAFVSVWCALLYFSFFKRVTQEPGDRPQES
jgi:hypothetical protein